MKDPQVNKIVSSSINRISPPFDILVDLQRKGFRLIDTNNAEITTPNKWRDAMKFHMVNCLEQDFELYDRAWKQKKTDDKLQADLQSAALAHGLITEDQLKDVLNSSQTIAFTPTVMDLVATGSNITREELIEGFRKLMPVILVQQLAIVHERQQNYMSGESANIDHRDINTVTQCLNIYKTLVGDFAVSDTVD
jgi:hypothetical protein